MRQLLASVLLATTASFAQPPAHPRPTPDPEIHLDVVVTRGAGQPVAGLDRADFSLLDNNSPQPISAFTAAGVAQSPVEATVVLDALNISALGIGSEIEEVGKFLKANHGRLALPTALVVFTEKGLQSLGGPTRDGNLLASALQHYNYSLRTIRRSEGFYGAVVRLQISLTNFQALAASEAGLPGRKLILWVSPGWPILSGPGVQLDSRQQSSLFAKVVQLSAQMRESAITLYSIDSFGAEEGVDRALYYEDFLKGVTTRARVAAGNLSLQVLAVQSGGLALNSTGVSQLLERCVQDATAYYEITFHALPAEQPNQYHHLEVRIARPGLTARTRNGYYAQP